jgi:cytochrome c oxidase subunit 2
MVALAALAACSDGAPAITSPRSEAAERVEGLWWTTFWISAVVVAIVTVLILVAVARARAPGDDGIDRRPVTWGPPFIVIAGLVVSGAILAATFYLSLRELDALAGPPGEPVLSIEVVGRNWWWEVRYPNGAATANEIRIPAGQPVEIRLSTADVIHTFWVPELQVKKDQIPGMDNTLWLLAREPGRYRGQCAEFCGLQHARMAFYVEALAPEAFEAWLAAEAAPARDPATASARSGRDIFLRSSCAGCHAIRGTTASGTLGPDLTHVASRQTLAAGVLPLARDTMHDFVANAQRAKPGAMMPPTELAPAEVTAVVDYLMGLS